MITRCPGTLPSLAPLCCSGCNQRSAETPTTQDLVHATASGSYLAARHAGIERDIADGGRLLPQRAEGRDPRNAELLSRAFLSVLERRRNRRRPAAGRRLLQVDRNDRIARLVVGVRALKQRQYGLARQNFAQSIRGPVTDLTGDAAVGAGPCRRRRNAAAPSTRSTGSAGRIGTPSSRIMHAAHDPRSCQQQKGCRQTLRARL